MKLLVVAPYPPCEDTNGLWAKAWSEALVRAHGEIQVHIAAGEEARDFDCPGPPADSPPKALTVRRVWDRGDRGSTIVRTVLAESDRFGPDVAHLHFNYLTFGNPVKSFSVLSRLLSGFARRGVRTVVTLHSVLASPVRYLASRWGLYLRLPSWLDRGTAHVSGFVLDRALQGADEIVVVSPGALEWMRERTQVGRSRAYCIALGSCRDDWELPAPVAVPRRATTPQVPRLVSVGRLVPYKGLEDLIRAVGMLSRQRRWVHLTIMGGVQPSGLSNRWYVQRLRRLAMAQEPGSVKLEVRYVQAPEYAGLQQEADVIVLPFRDDGVISSSGSVLDFGASCSARLVLTDVPRLKGYGAVRGVTYCRRGATELSEAIWAAAIAPPVDPTERRRDVADLTVASVSARYLETYLRLAGASPPPRPPDLLGKEPRGVASALYGVAGELVRPRVRNADLEGATEAATSTHRTGLLPVGELEQPPR